MTLNEVEERLRELLRTLNQHRKVGRHTEQALADTRVELTTIIAMLERQRLSR